ncbi:MAG: IS66 family transposase, partial [bacterium]|nr:IS66 family transposase [bacterium]
MQALLQEGRTQDVLTLVADLMANMNALQRQLNEVGAKRFKSREVVSSAQLGLLLTELKKAAAVAERDESLSKADDELQETVELEKMLMERDAEKKDKGKKKRKGGHKRKPFPPNIRREEKIIRVPDEKRGCPKCGKERTCIGYDVTETLDRVPAELVVRQDKQEKLCCKPCDGELCRAPAPDRVVKQGRLGIELVACLLVEKYHDGLPLHRQVQRFRRMGVDLPVSTLVDQVKHAAQAAKMLHEMAIEEVLASHVMHLDGTGLPVLDKAHRNGTRYGTLWGYVGDKVVSVFLYASTGKKKGQKPGELGPEDFLNRRTGFAVADASNLFDKSFERDDLIECGCNAHGRRGFVKALDGGDSRAALPIGAYSRLYSFEHQAKDLDDEARQKLREHKSKPVFDAILKWCQAYAPHEPPSSPLGRAIRYFINHHEALGRFIEDGAIPI